MSKRYKPSSASNSKKVLVNSEPLSPPKNSFQSSPHYESRLKEASANIAPSTILIGNKRTLDGNLSSALSTPKISMLTGIEPPAQTKASRPPQIRNRKFTPAEDERVIQFVTEAGGSCTHVQWLSLDEELGRQNLSAQLRWVNVLMPRLRNNLAEQSSMILAELHTGHNSSTSLDLPPNSLITTLQYKRHPFSAAESERIMQFAVDRTFCKPQTPWIRLDEELGRTSGATKHRYCALLMRDVKDTMKSMLNTIERAFPTPAPPLVAPPSVAPIRKVRRKAVLSIPDTASLTPEMSQVLSRVTCYTPKEDARITLAVRESPGGHMTSARWRALAAEMDRPDSWLRYRWAILQRREENVRAAKAEFATVLQGTPIHASIMGEMLNLVDTLVEAVCDTQQRVVNIVTPRAASAPSKKHTEVPPACVSSLPPARNKELTQQLGASDSFLSSSTLGREYTRAEMMHITVQMAKCQELGEVTWQALSVELALPPDTVKILWVESQKNRSRDFLLSNPTYIARVEEAVKEQLARQKDFAWRSLAATLHMSPAEVQSAWSRLWFAVHFPTFERSEPISHKASARRFTSAEDAVILRRMCAETSDCKISCWVSDLGVFLYKPVDSVIERWRSLCGPQGSAGKTTRAFDESVCGNTSVDSGESLVSEAEAEEESEVSSRAAQSAVHCYQSALMF